MIGGETKDIVYIKDGIEDRISRKTDSVVWRGPRSKATKILDRLNAINFKNKGPNGGGRYWLDTQESNDDNVNIPVVPAIPVKGGKTYPAQLRYDHFNKLLFGGQLPTIPIIFANRKGLAGVVTYRVWKRRFGGSRESVVQKTLVPDSMKMLLSTRFERSGENQDAILVHEMIHVHFAVTGQFSVNHGPQFVAMANKFSQQLGFTVPLTDNTSDLTPVNKKVKPYIVVLNTYPDRRTYAVFSATVLEKKVIMSAVLTMLKRRCPDVVAYKIETPNWSAYAQKVLVQRNPRAIQFSKETPVNSALLDELEALGEPQDFTPSQADLQEIKLNWMEIAVKARDVALNCDFRNPMLLQHGTELAYKGPTPIAPSVIHSLTANFRQIELYETPNMGATPCWSNKQYHFMALLIGKDGPNPKLHFIDVDKMGVKGT